MVGWRSGALRQRARAFRWANGDILLFRIHGFVFQHGIDVSLAMKHPHNAKRLFGGEVIRQVYCGACYENQS